MVRVFVASFNVRTRVMFPSLQTDQNTSVDIAKALPGGLACRHVQMLLVTQLWSHLDRPPDLQWRTASQRRKRVATVKTREKVPAAVRGQSLVPVRGFLGQCDRVFSGLRRVPIFALFGQKAYGTSVARLVVIGTCMCSTRYTC